MQGAEKHIQFVGQNYVPVWLWNKIKSHYCKLLKILFKLQIQKRNGIFNKLEGFLIFPVLLFWD